MEYHPGSLKGSFDVTRDDPTDFAQQIVKAMYVGRRPFTWWFYSTLTVPYIDEIQVMKTNDVVLEFPLFVEIKVDQDNRSEDIEEVTKIMIIEDRPDASRIDGKPRGYTGYGNYTVDEKYIYPNHTVKIFSSKDNIWKDTITITSNRNNFATSVSYVSVTNANHVTYIIENPTIVFVYDSDFNNTSPYELIENFFSRDMDMENMYIGLAGQMATVLQIDISKILRNIKIYKGFDEEKVKQGMQILDKIK